MNSFPTKNKNYKNDIKIAGAGLAGLTAAINLARAGYRVKIYEKTHKVGDHQKQTVQLLPNWFVEEDVIQELEACDIKINWLNKIEEVEILTSGPTITIYGKKSPVGYTVLRGGEGSLEENIAIRAKNLGVEIITGCKNVPEADILATGASKILTVGYGRVYSGQFEPSKVKVIFDASYTPTIGYCYFFPHDKNIATVKISRIIGENQINLPENLEKFQQDYLDKEIKPENFLYEFGSKRSFQIPQSAYRGAALLVGEAAGFQDELFRFGMRYAIISGYLAAKSIIEEQDYNLLWKKRFMDEFTRTTRARRAFQDFKTKGIGLLPENSDINIEIGKFKRIWLSRYFNFLLALYPLYRKLVFNRVFLKTGLRYLSSRPK